MKNSPMGNLEFGIWNGAHEFQIRNSKFLIAVVVVARVAVMSARPGRVSNVIPIDLPQPRTALTREEPRFFELVTAVREALQRLSATRSKASTTRSKFMIRRRF